MESIHDDPILLPPPKANKSAITPMVEDLHLEILKNLPTKTLCRFLCVSTSWETLISSSLFVNLHYSALSAATKPYIQLRQDDDDDNSSSSYLLRRPQRHRPTQLHFPFHRKNDQGRDFSTVVDVIHGVICLSYSFDSLFDCTVLWNPSIHRYVLLPWLPFTVDLSPAKDKFVGDHHEFVNIADYFINEQEGYIYIHGLEFGGRVNEFMDKAKFDCSVIGFGFDAPNHDFKVVRVWIPRHKLIQDYCNSIPPTYEVYSSRVGIWKVSTSDILKPCGFLDENPTTKTGCFVNGTIHWIVYAPTDENIRFGSELAVLMFDCGSEEFRIVDLPREFIGPQKIDLIEYGGVLAAVADSCKGKRSGRKDYIEMWVMEEHGVASSWKKLYRFKDIRDDDLEVSYDVYDDSYMKLAPYGPREWIMRNGYRRWGNARYVYDEMLSLRVYEETMFLMDDAEAESYTTDEMVCISN